MRTPIDMSKFSTKFLQDNQRLQKDRIEMFEKNLKENKFNEYFPNADAVKQALEFEKDELEVIEKELNKRGEI